jgi:hypothetical protein
MKKNNIIYFLLSAALLFTSCAKEYGYYEYTRLNIDLDLQGALGNFEEINEGDFLPTKDQRIRVQFFIYDTSGHLVNHQERTANDYYTTIECTLERLGLGDYTLIVATDLLEKKEGVFLPGYWEFTGTNTLNTFTAKGLDAPDAMGERLLTLTREEFTIDGRRKSKNVQLIAEPVTAMVCVTYFDIFYWDKNIVGNDPDYRIYSYFDVTYDHDMNEAQYVGGHTGLPWAFRETTNNAFYILNRIYPDHLSGLDISSIYSYHALLPGKYSFRGYGEYSFRGRTDIYPDETRPSSQLYVEPGCQYFIDFDIEAWTITFEESTLTRAEGDRHDARSIRAIDIPARQATRTVSDHVRQ